MRRLLGGCRQLKPKGLPVLLPIRLRGRSLERITTRHLDGLSARITLSALAIFVPISVPLYFSIIHRTLLITYRFLYRFIPARAEWNSQ